jgi:hypothetical protein
MCYIDMDHHIVDIDYDGQPLQITALFREDADNLVYDCYTAGVLLGTLQATFGNNPVVVWVADDMPAELVKLIGQEIERQDW